MPTSSGVALVLGGGASLGALQVGVLGELVKDGFRPSMVIGTSVGALNASYLAFHPGPEDFALLAATWMAIRTEDIFPRHPVRIGYRLLTGASHLYETAYIEELIQAFLPVDDFLQAEIPLYLTATNLGRGEKVVLSDGKVSEAILASIAIPGLLPPRLRDGQLLVDGGIVANLDIQTAVDHGAKQIIALDVGCCQALPLHQDFKGIMLMSQHLMLQKQTEDAIARFGTVAEIIVVCPSLDEPVDPTDFSRTGSLIEAGTRTGRGLWARVQSSSGQPTTDVGLTPQTRSQTTTVLYCGPANLRWPQLL